jgi:MATE family multidrug resistance protein
MPEQQPDTLTSPAREGRAGSGGGVFAELFAVAAPAVVTMTSYTLMQFVDKLILSRLGPEELAGAGNGGIAAFVPAAILIGGIGVINTYVSQHLGAGNPRAGAAYAWNGLWITLITWALVLLPFAYFVGDIFGGMRAALGLDAPPGAVAQHEITYAQILLGGMIFMLMSRALQHFFYGVHRPAVVMVAAIAGNLANVVLCYGLVLGELGLPQMGVAGAALSTVVGGIIEFVIPFALFISPRMHRRFATRARCGLSLPRVRDLVRLGWPGGLMGGNEIICWWIFMTGFVSSFDTPETGAVNSAAGWIVLQYMHLSFMPAVGLSIAMTAVVGKYVGAGDLPTARLRTWQGLGLTAAYMGVCALAFVVFREQLIMLFVDTQGEGFSDGQKAALIALGAKLLILAAAFQLFDAVAIALTGALRGAGDTVWPGVVTIVLSWSLIVGLGAALVEYAPELGSVGPWIAAAVYIIVLSIAFFGRFISGAWERFAVAGPRSAQSGVGPAMGQFEAETEGLVV